jgi:hypothetical protein
VASYILYEDAVGILPAQGILSVLTAIEQVHDLAGVANPVRCHLARLAIERIVRPDPPSGWSGERKADWALLPVEIREEISLRENQRNRALRQAQNRAAELRQSADSADKSISNKPSETEKEVKDHVD